jgi:hypothetical protein
MPIHGVDRQTAADLPRPRHEAAHFRPSTRSFKEGGHGFCLNAPTIRARIVEVCT